MRLAATSGLPGWEAFFPLCMHDGRLLMVVSLDWEHDSAARYAVMDADEFLNGGSAYREMTFAGERARLLGNGTVGPCPAAAEFSITGKDVYP